MITRACRSNHLSSFSPYAFARLDPRSIFTYAFISSLLTQLGHDVLIYYIKYQEGYVFANKQTRPVNQTSPLEFYYYVTSTNDDNAVIENPRSNWNKQDLDYYANAHYLSATSMGLMM